MDRTLSRPPISSHVAQAPWWRRVAAWLDLYGRREGWLAFILMRLTGIGLVVYLFLHLTVLSTLARGPQAWDAFIALAHSPLFIAFDAVLIFGMLFHGLNGLRVILLGLGFGSRHQAGLFWAAFILTIVLTAVAVRMILVIS